MKCFHFGRLQFNILHSYTKILFVIKKWNRDRGCLITITQLEPSSLPRWNYQHQKKILSKTPCATTWLIKMTIQPNMLWLQCAVFTCCKVLFTLFFAVTGIVKLSFVTTPPGSASFFFSLRLHRNLINIRNNFSMARASMFMTFIRFTFVPQSIREINCFMAGKTS